MMLGPATFAQFTRSSGSPAALACFSTSLSRSISMSGRKLTPYCWATWTSFTSAETGKAKVTRTPASRSLLMIGTVENPADHRQRVRSASRSNHFTASNMSNPSLTAVPSANHR